MVPSNTTEDEIVPDPSEALEFQRVRRAKPKRRGIWMFLLMVLVGGVAGAGWYYYGNLLMAGDGDDIQIIRAAEGPVKVRPKTPGGMAIPDRDKLVYDRMNGGVPEPRVERLLPLPEMPKTPPAPEPRPKPAEAPPGLEKPKLLAKPQMLEPGKVELRKAEKKTEPSASLTKEPSASLTKEPPASLTKESAVTVNLDMMPKEPESSAIEKKKSPPQPTETNVSNLAYQIQIAAVRSREQAESEWARLKKKHGDLLSGYSLNIVRADLGADKGVFFRLRAGPIAGEDVAQALCQNLSKRKVGCLIVRPGG